jgi:hypothetical protein
LKKQRGLWITPNLELPDDEMVPSLDSWQFQGVRSSKLRFILYRILPLCLIAGTTAVSIQQGLTLSVWIYASMILAFLLTLFLFKSMMGSIPATFHTLAIRGILIQNCPATDNDLKACANNKKYLNFMQDFENSLNKRSGQIVFGLFFAAVLLSRSYYDLSKWLPEDFSNIPLFSAGDIGTQIWALYVYITLYITSMLSDMLRFFTGFVLEPILGYFLGLIAWRMLITGLQIYQVDKKFSLVPRLNDPDQCGGLNPLGKLCLYNAKIVGIWGGLLGIWIILGTSYQVHKYYLPLYYNQMPVLLLVAVAGFFIPLWGVHCAMAKKKVDLDEKLDQIAKNINELAQKRLDWALKGEQEPDSVAEDIEKMKKVYAENVDYPVWPFNYRLILSFVTSQAIPLLGLTGLGAPILNVIRFLLDFLNQLGRT